MQWDVECVLMMNYLGLIYIYIFGFRELAIAYVISFTITLILINIRRDILNLNRGSKHPLKP
jgi:hypothetical protein